MLTIVTTAILRMKARGRFQALWPLCGSGALLILLAPPVMAESDPRDLCPARPGLATPPCIVDSGHVMVELSHMDWTMDRQDQVRTDTLLSGDVLLRLGVNRLSEVQIGITPFGFVRSRDHGQVHRASGVGDIIVAVKRSVTHPDGSGLSIAVQPFATLPTGSAAIGAGDWSAGVIVPVSVPLSDKVQFALSPELDDVVDGDGKGRHLAFGGVMGLGIALGPAISTAIELSIMHDDDPDGAQRQSLAGLSFAWQPSDNWQLDVGSAIGLNRYSPDAEIYLGVARRF